MSSLLKMAMVATSSSVAARMTRMAISPRLATSSLVMGPAPNTGADDDRLRVPALARPSPPKAPTRGARRRMAIIMCDMAGSAVPALDVQLVPSGWQVGGGRGGGGGEGTAGARQGNGLQVASRCPVKFSAAPRAVRAHVRAVWPAARQQCCAPAAVAHGAGASRMRGPAPGQTNTLCALFAARFAVLGCALRPRRHRLGRLRGLQAPGRARRTPCSAADPACRLALPATHPQDCDRMGLRWVTAHCANSGSRKGGARPHWPALGRAQRGARA